MIPVHSLFERTFISEADYHYRVDDWYNKETTLLFILGLSGSGKTTDGIKIAKKNQAGHIPLDRLLWSPVRKEFFDKHGRNPETATEHTQILFDVVFKFKELLPKLKKRAVVEGVWPLYYSPEVLKDHSVIIKRTSVMKSTYRLLKRTNSKVDKPLLTLMNRLLNGKKMNTHLDKKVKAFIQYFEGLK